MAKNKQTRSSFIEDAISPEDQRRASDAELILKRMGKKYRPIPKFRGGCNKC